MSNSRDVTSAAPAPDWRPMRLQYCSRCGALCVRPDEAPDGFCPACARVLRWLHGEVDDATRRR